MSFVPVWDQPMLTGEFNCRAPLQSRPPRTEDRSSRSSRRDVGKVRRSADQLTPFCPAQPTVSWASRVITVNYRELQTVRGLRILFNQERRDAASGPHAKVTDGVLSTRAGDSLGLGSGAKRFKYAGDYVRDVDDAAGSRGRLRHRNRWESLGRTGRHRVRTRRAIGKYVKTDPRSSGRRRSII